MLIFVEGGKLENPEKNPRSKDENQQQTQPTYDAGSSCFDVLGSGSRSAGVSKKGEAPGKLTSHEDAFVTAWYDPD